MLNNETIEVLKNMLVEDEGLYLKKYKCTKGIDTVGVGYGSTFGITPAIQNITGKNTFDEIEEVTEQQALEILEYMIRYFEMQVSNKYSWYIYKSQATKLVILNIVFNIGLRGFSKFKNTIKAIELDNLQRAGLELIDSSYLTDVKGRALRNAYILKSQNIYVEKEYFNLEYKILEMRL
jgi:GH24 family phage-related lysozyme (muramidase)